MGLAVKTGRKTAVCEVFLRKAVSGTVTGLPRGVVAHGANASQHLFASRKEFEGLVTFLIHAVWHPEGVCGDALLLRAKDLTEHGACAAGCQSGLVSFQALAPFPFLPEKACFPNFGKAKAEKAVHLRAEEVLRGTGLRGRPAGVFEGAGPVTSARGPRAGRRGLGLFNQRGVNSGQTPSVLPHVKHVFWRYAIISGHAGKGVHQGRRAGGSRWGCTRKGGLAVPGDPAGPTAKFHQGRKLGAKAWFALTAA